MIALPPSRVVLSQSSAALTALTALSRLSVDDVQAALTHVMLVETNTQALSKGPRIRLCLLTTALVVTYAILYCLQIGSTRHFHETHMQMISEGSLRYSCLCHDL